MPDYVTETFHGLLPFRYPRRHLQSFVLSASDRGRFGEREKEGEDQSHKDKDGVRMERERITKKREAEERHTSVKWLYTAKEGFRVKERGGRGGERKDVKLDAQG